MLTMRNRLALLLATTLGAMMPERDHKAFGYDKRRSRGPDMRHPFRGVFSFNRFKPHQGAREMARRRGGMDWDKFKAADRLRRGLPVSWPYQCMEG